MTRVIRSQLTFRLTILRRGFFLTAGTIATYNAATGFWQATGTLADVNGALAAVAFAPNADWNGTVNIISHVHDAKVTGPANGLIIIPVTAVNDAPITSDLAPSTAEDTSVVITGWTFDDTKGSGSRRIDCEQSRFCDDRGSPRLTEPSPVCVVLIAGSICPGLMLSGAGNLPAGCQLERHHILPLHGSG